MRVPDTPTPVQAARFEKDAQLHLFGIDSSSRPTPTRFPKTFNPQAMKIWVAILASDDFKAFSNKNASSALMWEYAVKAYLKECSAQNVYAFTGKADFEETASKFLGSARRHLVAWFKQSGIFNVAKVHSVTREHHFTQNNFKITVTAQLRPITDPTFEKWLTQLPSPGFRKEEGVYRKNVQAHVSVEFEMRRGTPFLSYHVFCHTPVRSLEPSLIGKSKLSKYVETKLWNPVIKTNPIDGIGNRRF